MELPCRQQLDNQGTETLNNRHLIDCNPHYICIAVSQQIEITAQKRNSCQVSIDLGGGMCEKIGLSQKSSSNQPCD